MKTDTPEECWNTFWKDIIAPNGTVDLEQLKRELHDYSLVLRNVGLVYDHVTGGRISKSNTLASVVIAAHDEMVDRWVQECIEESRDGSD